MQSNPLVSVVILNYNGKSCLEPCLRSVFASTYPNFEVVLLDNASKDDSMSRAEKIYGSDPRLKLVRNPVNEGFSGGNNTGYTFTKGKYIIFLNNDTVVAPDWIEPLVDAMENDSSIGLAQSLILNIDGDTIQNVGWLFSDYLVHKYALGNGKPSTLKFAPVFEVSFGCGASMMIRRVIVDEMGLFDPAMPFFYDDTLLSLKTWLVQKRVVTVSRSRIRHISGATKVWKIRFTTYHLHKSNLCLLFDVYQGLSSLSRALAVHLLYLSSSSLFSLKKRNVAAVLGSIDAFAWGISHLGYLWQNRLNHKTKVEPAFLKEKFLRIKLPVSLYFLPSKLSRNYFAAEVKRHEQEILIV